MKKITFLLLTLLSINTLNAQIVTIPDANFKAALVNDMAINSNADAEIQVNEATAYTGIIDVSNKNISDLTGIEAFVNIFYLDCSINLLTNLNVTSNTALTQLFCGDNQLTTLDVTNNINLIQLYAGYNQLSSIDVTNNTSLDLLYIGVNLISSVNVNNNVNLTKLGIGKTQIATVNLSNNTALTNLFAQNTMLTSLDLTNNNSLQVTWLDSNINLATLNLKNGNNTAIFSFQALGNPNLTCITVDDTAWSNANWTMKDAIASYSTNCSVGVEQIKNNKILNTYPNPANKLLTIAVKNKPINESFTVSITDFTGKIVLQTKITNTESIDVSRLANGIYQLRLKGNDFVIVKKVVVAR